MPRLFYLPLVEPGVSLSPKAVTKKTVRKSRTVFGAEDEARTRYLHLGKVALYQMSYSRTKRRTSQRLIIIANHEGIVKAIFAIFSKKESAFGGTLHFPKRT